MLTYENYLGDFQRLCAAAYRVAHENRLRNGRGDDIGLGQNTHSDHVKMVGSDFLLLAGPVVSASNSTRIASNLLLQQSQFILNSRKPNQNSREGHLTRRGKEMWTDVMQMTVLR